MKISRNSFKKKLPTHNSQSRLGKHNSYRYFPFLCLPLPRRKVESNDWFICAIFEWKKGEKITAEAEQRHKGKTRKLLLWNDASFWHIWYDEKMLNANDECFDCQSLKMIKTIFTRTFIFWSKLSCKVVLLC